MYGLVGIWNAVLSHRENTIFLIWGWCNYCSENISTTWYSNARGATHITWIYFIHTVGRTWPAFSSFGHNLLVVILNSLVEWLYLRPKPVKRSPSVLQYKAVLELRTVACSLFYSTSTFSWLLSIEFQVQVCSSKLQVAQYATLHVPPVSEVWSCTLRGSYNPGAVISYCTSG